MSERGTAPIMWWTVSCGRTHRPLGGQQLCPTSNRDRDFLCYSCCHNETSVDGRHILRRPRQRLNAGCRSEQRSALETVRAALVCRYQVLINLHSCVIAFRTPDSADFCLGCWRRSAAPRGKSIQGALSWLQPKQCVSCPFGSLRGRPFPQGTKPTPLDWLATTWLSGDPPPHTHCPTRIGGSAPTSKAKSDGAAGRTYSSNKHSSKPVTYRGSNVDHAVELGRHLRISR